MCGKSFVLPVVTSLFLIGCGGGGGGGDSTPVSSNPPAAPVTAPATYLFYSASLHAVDPANAAAPMLVDANATQARQIFHASYDGATRTASGIHARSIVYVSGGKVWKVSALVSDGVPGSAGNQPVQLSSESAISTSPDTTLCFAWVADDYGNHNNARYAYKLAGTDGSCNTTDDVVKLVALGMSSTTAPLGLPPGWEPMVAIHDPNSGALIAALFLDRSRNELVRRNADLTGSATVVKQGVTTKARDVLVTNDNRMFLDIDGDLYLYNLATGQLSASLFSSGSTSTELVGDSDGSALYFMTLNGATAIYKFPFSGTSAVDRVTLAQEVSGTAIWATIGLTSNRIAYVTYTAGSSTFELKSVAKTGGAPIPLVGPTSESLMLIAAAGNRVYYNRGGVGTSTSVAAVINEDGSSPVTLPGSSWAGVSVPTTVTTGETFAVSRVLLAEFNVVTGTLSGGTLTSYDATTYSNPVTLGTIPDGVSWLFLWGNDSRLLGFVFAPDGNGGSQTDIVFVDTATAGSLVRVTDTPGVRESEVF